MRRLLFIFALFISFNLHAAHITDKLLAGVYKTPDKDSKAIMFLNSGAPLEVIETQNGFTKVRTSDDTIGWVKNQYVTEELPTNARLIDLQERMSKMRKELQRTKDELKKARDETTIVNVSSDDEKSSKLLQQIQSLKQDKKKLKRQLETAKKEVKTVEVVRSARMPGQQTMSEEGLVLFELKPWHLYSLLAFMLFMLILGYMIKSMMIKRKYGGFSI